MLAGVQHRDRTHVGVLLDPHAQRKIRPSERGRHMEGPHMWLWIAVHKQMQRLDVALGCLWDLGVDADGRERGILGTVGRFELDNASAVKHLGLAKMAWLDEGLPNVHLALVGNRAGRKQRQCAQHERKKTRGAENKVVDSHAQSPY